MKTSSSEARCGVSSCRTNWFAKATSPIADAVAPVTVKSPSAFSTTDSPCARSTVAKFAATGASHEDRALRGGGEVIDRPVANEASAADDNDLVSGERHLTHQVGADKTVRPSAASVRRGREPTEFPRSRPLTGLVLDNNNRGITQNRRRDAEALAHADENRWSVAICTESDDVAGAHSPARQKLEIKLIGQSRKEILEALHGRL